MITTFHIMAGCTTIDSNGKEHPNWKINHLFYEEILRSKWNLPPLDLLVNLRSGGQNALNKLQQTWENYCPIYLPISIGDGGDDIFLMHIDVDIELYLGFDGLVTQGFVIDHLILTFLMHDHDVSELLQALLKLASCHNIIILNEKWLDGSCLQILQYDGPRTITWKK